MDFEPKKPHPPQVPEDKPQVLPGTTEDDVDGITLRSFEVVAMQKAVVFHVPDDRFDGVASFEFTMDTLCHTAFLSCIEHLNIRDRDNRDPRNNTRDDFPSNAVPVPMHH